jgi:hypothetical protein
MVCACDTIGKPSAAAPVPAAAPVKNLRRVLAVFFAVLCVLLHVSYGFLIAKVYALLLMHRDEYNRPALNLWVTCW